MHLRHCLWVALLGAAVVWACKPQRRAYTIPSVTKEIEDEVVAARELKRGGSLAKASEKLLALSNRVLSEYPEATLTQESVKKVLDAAHWIGNLCLDKALELGNTAVSQEEDEAKKRFQSQSETHQANVGKLRDLMPRLQKAPKAGEPAKAGKPGRASAPPAMAGGKSAPPALAKPDARPKSGPPAGMAPAAMSAPMAPGMGAK